MATMIVTRHGWTWDVEGPLDGMEEATAIP
jgi:hypothetical protein